jgi:hypothetical protein
MLRTLRILGIGVLCVMGLLAQSAANKATINGSIFDPNQALVPNASVSIKNTGTGAVRTVSSNESGFYLATFVDPGSYEIEAKAPGFAPKKVATVVYVGTTATIDLVLSLTETTETVEVTDTLINLAVPTLSTIVDQTAVRDLPINGRRFQDFAVLTPTVQIEPQRQQLSFAGQRGVNSNVMLDGADYTQPFFGGIRGGERSNFVITVPQSAVQEFQVVASGYSAEYGRSTGGVLNAVTRSGANDMHGDLFYQIRHKEMGKTNPLGQNALETLQQFGGGVGGPVFIPKFYDGRNRTFFFVAAEAQRSRIPRQVLFPELNNVVRSDANAEAFDFFRSQEQPFQQTNNAHAYTGRMDFLANNGSRIAVRYNRSSGTGENAVSVGGSLNPATDRALTQDGTEGTAIHLGGIQWTQVFSPSVVNDLRFTATNEERPRTANSALPQVDARNVGFFGARNFLPTVQDDQRLQIANTLSANLGNHTVKVGVDYNRLTTFQTFGFNQFGGFFFTDRNSSRVLEWLSAGGPAGNRFNTGAARFQRQTGNLIADFGTDLFAIFMTDNWRVTNSLSIDAGFRWEGQYNPTPEANNSSLINAIQGFTFPRGSQIDPTTIPNQTEQFMPRFGFTYSPTKAGKRFVLRGNTGIFYATTPLLVLSAPTNNFRTPAGDLSLEVRAPQGQTLYDVFLAGGIDLNRFSLGALPVLSQDDLARLPAAAARPNVTVMPQDFRNPRSLQIGLGMEQELWGNLVAGAQFTYVNTVNNLRNVNHNLAPPTVLSSRADGRPIFDSANRPNSAFADVTVRESSARAMYRAITTSLQYRGRRVQFGGFYTAGENFSDDDTERDAGGFNYQDAFNFRAEYGPSRLDVRHDFTGNAVVFLPWGFQASGIFRARTGLPFNAIANSDLNGDNVAFTDRPFSAPGVSFGRNAFRNRSFRNVDFRVLKDFRITENAKVQFSAELFNLFNFENVIFAGNTNVYGPGISAATGAVVPADSRFMRLRNDDGSFNLQNQQLGTPLQAQFGLRFIF